MTDVPATEPTTGKVYTETEFANTQAQMRAAREEAKGHRLTAQNAEAAKLAAETALAAEKNTLTEKLTAADARYVRSELKAEAIAAGINDASDALAMIPLDKIVRDADGNPTNTAELLADLKTAKPYLFAVAGTPMRGTSSTVPAPKAAPVAAKSVTDMTDEEYAAAKFAATRKR